jgi:hypothetical protein
MSNKVELLTLASFNNTNTLLPTRNTFGLFAQITQARS